MTMTDVCDISDPTPDGITIQYRQQEHIDVLQSVARRVRRVLTEHGDYGVSGMDDRIERLETAVGSLNVISATRWTADQVNNVFASVYSLLRMADSLPGFAGLIVGEHGIDLDVLHEAAEPLDEALRLMATMRLRQAGGAA